MRAEFIVMEIYGGDNTNKLLRRDGANRYRKLDDRLLRALIEAKQRGLPINFKKL